MQAVGSLIAITRRAKDRACLAIITILKLTGFFKCARIVATSLLQSLRAMARSALANFWTYAGLAASVAWDACVSAGIVNHVVVAIPACSNALLILEKEPSVALRALSARACARGAIISAAVA